MDGGALLILLILGLALAICFLTKPSTLFVVRIRSGLPQVRRGKVTDAFLDAIKEICQDTGIQTGEVRGVPRGGRITLWFSRELPNGFRQRLRNWWEISGWPAKRGSRRA